MAYFIQHARTLFSSHGKSVQVEVEASTTELHKGQKDILVKLYHKKSKVMLITFGHQITFQQPKEQVTIHNCH